MIDAPPTDIYTLSLHDALPISRGGPVAPGGAQRLPVRHRDVVAPHRRGRQAVPSALHAARGADRAATRGRRRPHGSRSEEHTSELQSRLHLVCRLLLEKKNKQEPLIRPILFYTPLPRYCLAPMLPINSRLGPFVWALPGQLHHALRAGPTAAPSC